jgi:branched-chain amino acid transport system ATP-binding protein
MWCGRTRPFSRPISGTTMLEIAGLNAGYGRIGVLKQLALTVGSGEIVAILGANGAGKTTLLRTISGLIAPSAGRIEFDGASIAGRAAERIVAAGVSMVPEGRRVFAPLTVRDNLTMGAYLRLRARDRAVDDDLASVFALFPPLAQRAGQLAGALSGGEQQMLAIGRALMARPRLLMLDEPSMGLAPLVVGEIFRTIERLNQQGVTILLAEQNARMALKVAQRGYILESGAIVAAAPAATLRADPAVQQAYLGV